MPGPQESLQDRGTHLEVVCYVDGMRRKFWSVKSKMQPGKDGRLYGHHGDLTLAVDSDGKRYAVLQRKDTKGLLLPPRLSEDGTPGRSKRKPISEGERELAAEKRKKAKQQRTREHVAAALFLCDVSAERWAEVEADIGLPSCGESSRQDWLDKLDDCLGIGEKLDALALILGCQKRKAPDGGR